MAIKECVMEPVFSFGMVMEPVFSKDLDFY